MFSSDVACLPVIAAGFLRAPYPRSAQIYDIDAGSTPTLHNFDPALLSYLNKLKIIQLNCIVWTSSFVSCEGTFYKLVVHGLHIY